MNMISDTIKYIGVDDLDIDLFESQYVVPEGMSYNSYLKQIDVKIINTDILNSITNHIHIIIISF